MFMRILFPITCNVLTPGHIRCIRYLSKLGVLFISVLNAKALSGYKKEYAPFKDRKEILETVALAYGGAVVEQDSLNPAKNVRKYKCTALASGDGFEKEEKEVIKKYQLVPLTIRFKGEKIKKFSSSKILAK
jgi:glycerol-3-phosphate cytidylyltransferase-like family protein